MIYANKDLSKLPTVIGNTETLLLEFHAIIALVMRQLAGPSKKERLRFAEMISHQARYIAQNDFTAPFFK